ncbi:MAG: hypothetical protein ACNA8W_15520, partial [Bradymonadaceae bacterium]
MSESACGGSGGACVECLTDEVCHDGSCTSVPGGDPAYKVRNKEWAEVYTQAVHDHYDTVFNNETDYPSAIYVDPDYAGGNSDGTIERPFTSLEHVPETTSNVAFLIKRGTSHSLSSRVAFKGDNIMVGAYGEGDRPHLDGSQGLECHGDDCLLRDLDIRSIRFGNYGGPWANNARMFNTRIHGTPEIVFFGVNNKAIGVEVLNNTKNAIFIQQRDLSLENHTEIGYSYIHTINQVWFPDGKPETEASGDGIQFNPYRGSYHIHNNIIDRSDTGNKFCIINNPGNNGFHPVYGLIEKNYLYGPKSYPSGGNVLYFGNVEGGNETTHHHIE